MDAAALLTESFGRIPDLARRAVTGLTSEQLVARPGPDANPIAWLVWHLTRVQDDHVADLAGTEQVWTADGWARRFDLPLDAYPTLLRADRSAAELEAFQAAHPDRVAPAAANG